MNYKALIDTITGGTFMRLHWEKAFKILYQISKTNQDWHTHNVFMPTNNYMIEAFVVLRVLDDSVA